MAVSCIMRKTIKIIFTLSVLLNLVLLGVICGGFYKVNRWHDSDLNVSEQSRVVIKTNMLESRAQMRESFQEVRKYNAQLKEIMEAENFDPQAYDAVIEKILTTKAAVSRQKAEAMGKTLAILPLEDRRKFSSKVLRILSHKHGKRGDKPSSAQKNTEDN